MRVKNLVLGIGIIVVYALVLWQGVEAFYPAPEWDDFCDDFSRPVQYKEGADCVYPSTLETRINSCNKIGGYFNYDYDENGCIVGGECDECQINYDEARDEHSRNIFIIALIIGVITLIGGFSILKIEPVGSALVGSGIWAIFYGTVANWRNFGASIRFVLLLIVLVILIWIAVKINSQRKRGGLFGWWRG